MKAIVQRHVCPLLFFAESHGNFCSLYEARFRPRLDLARFTVKCRSACPNITPLFLRQRGPAVPRGEMWHWFLGRSIQPWHYADSFGLRKTFIPVCVFPVQPASSESGTVWDLKTWKLVVSGSFSSQIWQQIGLSSWEQIFCSCIWLLVVNQA